MEKRRKFTSDFKSKVALEALREQPTIQSGLSERPTLYYI